MSIRGGTVVCAYGLVQRRKIKCTGWQDYPLPDLRGIRADVKLSMRGEIAPGRSTRRSNPRALLVTMRRGQRGNVHVVVSLISSASGRDGARAQAEEAA